MKMSVSISLDYELLGKLKKQVEKEKKKDANINMSTIVSRALENELEEGK